MSSIEGALTCRGRYDPSSFGHGIAAMEANWPFCWASDDLPVAWSEAFDADVFAALPLRAKLGLRRERSQTSLKFSLAAPT